MVRFDIRPANGGGYLWRLLSGNNRTMATGAREHADRDDCMAQLRRTVEVAAVERPRLVHEDDGAWSWTLLDGDEPIARSSVTYSRRIDCVHAIDRFGELAAEFTPAALDGTTARHPRRGR